MKNQNEVQKELQELSPLLAKLKAQAQKQEVPENYFQSLPNQVWEQIKLQPAPERPTKPAGVWERLMNALQILLQPRVAVSLATFAVLILVGIYFLKPEASVVPVNNELTAEDITSYIKDNIQEFDTDLLMKATADLPSQSILSESNWSDEDIDLIMEEIIKDTDTKTLEDML